MTVWTPSLNSRYAPRNHSVRGNARISRTVVASWRKPLRGRPAVSRTGRLRSRDTVKTVNAPHHRPAVARQIRTASPVVSPRDGAPSTSPRRSEEHTSELQSRQYLVCRLLLEKNKLNDAQ